MHHRKGILAIIVSLGLALALLPLSITGGDNGPVTVGIDAPAEVEAGSSFVANVTVDWVTDFDSCGFDVTYDETVITATDVTGGVIDGHAVEVAPGDWSYIPAGPDTGRIRVAATISGPPGCGINGTGYLAQIHFDAVGSGGDSSVINLEGVGMYDCNALAISTTTMGASVDISGPAPPVGGTARPISKVAIVALWIAVGAAIIVGTSLLVRRRRRAIR
ncbi:MAG: cohesin domain-containing protein [Dehalococcoidia bacterium]